MEQMKQLIREAMEGGAAGFSTGLFYTPGAYSSTNEIVGLVKVIKPYNGFYATHMRDESNYTVGLQEAVSEAVTIGEKTGVRVEISHLKALGKPVWGMSDTICRLIEEARERGVLIGADQYPYNASSTGLSAAVIPSGLLAGGHLKENLSDPATLPEIKKEILQNIERRGGPESLVIISYPKDHRFDGKNLAEISRIIQKPLAETAIFLVLYGSPGIVSFNMQESDIRKFMTQDYVMTCSDGHLEIPGEDLPHPRCYGAFTRKIRKYVLDDHVISMNQAIAAATSLPAGMIGLKDRGYLKEGYMADIVIFNPDSIRDNATFTDPHKYSSGIEYLFVNGVKVISSENYLGILAGRPLRFPQ
jgi:N-acyl-D-amino-acid deacylase